MSENSSHSMKPPNAKDQIDFRELVDEYYAPLYRFAYSLARNESDAGDLVQQTFTTWATKGHSLREASKVKSWLFTTLYREFLRVRRKNAPRVEIEPEALDGEMHSVTPDYVSGLDAGAAVEALQRIDPIYREPLTLFYLKDMAYKEIAEVLGLPIGTVMSRLSRGKAQLKQELLGQREKSATRE